MRSTLALVVVLAALVLPVSAQAANSISLKSPNGRVVVELDPLRISFFDTAGRTVLRQVAPAGGIGVVPPVPENQFGTQSPPPPALYAPFPFLVGSHKVSQTPSGQWQGTLQNVTEAGALYAATKVRSVVADGRGLHFVVETSDPTGRILDVKIQQDGRGFRVTAVPAPTSDVAAIGDAFTSSPKEAFHGFGGRHDSIDARGTEFFTYLQQENVSSGSADRLTTASQPSRDRYMFPNGPYATYYAQSQFISSAGYGFWLNRDQIARWRMASDRPDAWHVESAGDQLDYFVMPGKPSRAIGSLTELTGRQPVPPAWALGGTILDRLVKFPSDDAKQHQAEIESDLANMRKHGVKPAAYRIEGWAELPPAVLKKEIATLRRRGIHPMVYFRAFVGKDTTGTDDPKYYDEAVSKGYVATHADGSPYVFTSNFSNDAAVIDFTNPAAEAWWQGRIRAALRAGADGFMQDFGEQVMDDMHFHDGSTGSQMHNRFPILFHKATARAVAQFRKWHPHRQIWWFTRSGYSGSAAFEPGNFPGDETTDWTRSSGLASQTTDMLNRAVGGAFGFTTDIGGYFDIGPYPPTSKELFIRWAEWAALSPFFRLHGSLLAGTHMPWTYDSQTLRLFKSMAALHRRAEPLLRRLWRTARRTGTPPTRPLWLQFPGDARAAVRDQDWMLGPDVLVAPVVTEGAVTRSVYFPRGCWKGAGVTVRGPRSRTVKAPLTRLPYFVRCGSKPFRVKLDG